MGDTDKTSETAQGTVYIYPETDSTFLFYFYKNKGAPSYNMGILDGRATIKDGKGIYGTKFDYTENGYALYFEFKDNTLTVTEDETDYDCGFGHGVYADGMFLRQSTEIPEYYISATNEKIYFSELPERWEKQSDNSAKKMTR